MQHIKPGDFITIEDNAKYFYFLILSKSAFFGCQWAYAFHKTSYKLLESEELIESFNDGYYALIDFIEERRANRLIKIDNIKDYESYNFRSNLKARIDQYKGGFLWYIYDKQFCILEKKEKLEKDEMSFPIASGINGCSAIKLILKKWKNNMVINEANNLQFPVD